MKRAILILLTTVLILGAMAGCGPKAFNTYSDFFNTFDDTSETDDSKDFKSNITKMMGNNEIKSEDYGTILQQIEYKNVRVADMTWDVVTLMSSEDSSVIWMNVDFDDVQSTKESYENIKKKLVDEFGQGEEYLNDANNLTSSWSFSGSYIELGKNEETMGLRLFYST